MNPSGTVFNHATFNHAPFNHTLGGAFLKSPLRYPGGKSRALKFLAKHLPRDFAEYREPFFGGGSVGLFLAQALMEAKKAAENSLFAPDSPRECRFFASDLNYDVYCFWQVLKTQSTALIGEIQALKDQAKDGRELYGAILRRRDGDLSEIQRAVDFFVLNRITFSGVADCGGYSQKAFESRFTQSSIERLAGIAPILRGFSFSHAGYEELLFLGGEGVFIFLDPPYFSATKSRLYGRNGDLHLGFDHARLCENLKKTAHKFLLTYDDCEYIRKLYADFCIKEYDLQYGMNNFKRQSAARGRELLIGNWA